MNRFTFGLGYKEYSVDFDNYKYVLGNDTKGKFSLYSVVKSVFNKVNNSEFANEVSNKHLLKFNDRPLDVKAWRFFEVTPFFDLESDLKMGAKSLFSKYLDCFGDYLEQNEIYNTLTILINSLNGEFFDNETSIDFCDKKVKLQIGDITRSTLSKEIYPIISGNDYECNSSDINYEEIIMLQLSVIEKILSKSGDKNTFVYCYIPYLTKRIEVAICGMTYDNSFILVDTSSTPRCDTKNILIMGKHVIDFGNDEDINDKIMDLPFHIDKDDLKNCVKNALDNQKLDFGDRVIVELFS